MTRPRFTIGGLLLIVGFLAVGLAGMRAGTDAWNSGVFGLTLVVLLASVVLAIHGSGSRRAYWLGFVLFGGVYLALTLVTDLAVRLPTTKGLMYLDSMMPGRDKVVFTYAMTTMAPTAPVAPTPPDGTNTVATDSLTATIAPSVGIVNQAGITSIVNFTGNSVKSMSNLSGNTESFVGIGHSLLALIAGFLGAIFSRAIHAREAARQRRLDEPDASPRTISPTEPMG